MAWALLVVIWIVKAVEGLKRSDESEKVPRFFFCRASKTLTMRNTYDYHIGDMIHEVLRKQGRTVVWLASQIPCTTNNMHKILKKQSIDIELLYRISSVLDYNFFQEIV